MFDFFLNIPFKVTFEANDQNQDQETEQIRVVDNVQQSSRQNEPLIEYTPYSNEEKTTRGDIPSMSPPCEEVEAKTETAYRVCGNNNGCSNKQRNCENMRPVQPKPQPTFQPPEKVVIEPSRPCANRCPPKIEWNFPTPPPFEFNQPCLNSCPSNNNNNWGFPSSFPQMSGNLINQPEVETFEPFGPMPMAPLPEYQQPIFIYYPSQPAPFPDFPSLPPLPPMPDMSLQQPMGPTFGGLILAPGYVFAPAAPGFGSNAAMTDCVNNCNRIDTPFNPPPFSGNNKPCNE